MSSKLIKELPDLVKNEVISKEIASKIESYYQSKQDGAPNKLFAIFGVLGALLIGLGIILILAHNWDDFSRATKTVFAFLPLCIGQLFVGYSILKKKSISWKEASGTFLFFAVGASIALVSQIYNISGDLSAYLLTWVLLCLPLIYLLKSNALVILHIVFATFYAMEYGYSFMSVDRTPWLYLVLIALVLPHYFQLLKHKAAANITSIFNWLIPLSFVIILGAFVDENEDLGFLMYTLMFALFYNIGKIPFFDHQKLRRNGFLIMGSLGTIVLLLTMSFEELWHIKKASFNAQETYISIVLFMLCLAVLMYSFSKKWIQGFNLFQFVFIFFVALYFFGFYVPIVGTVLVNILVLALGVTTIKIGADKFHFGVLNYGLLIITALVVCRFFDTNMSFVIRGLLFVSVGAGFFLTNYIMLKKQKARKN